jgi:hypothetical protein
MREVPLERAGVGHRLHDEVFHGQPVTQRLGRPAHLCVRLTQTHIAILSRYPETGRPQSENRTFSSVRSRDFACLRVVRRMLCSGDTSGGSSMRTLALALLSCALLSLPVTASAAPHRVAVKKVATHPAKQHAKAKATPHHAKPAQHVRDEGAGRARSSRRYASRAQHS